jgi:hypothetical protein
VLSIAFKEWAVICRALAEGRQSLILRKGGIAETGGEFRPEHDRFLLLPTYFHEQHREGIKPELLPLLDAAEAERPPAGVLRFSHFVEVRDCRHVADLDRALALDPLHGWTAASVRQRFQYRAPGLFALTVRTFRLKWPVEVPDRPEYSGCKSWVPLTDEVAVADAEPVLTEEAFERYRREVAAKLG